MSTLRLVAIWGILAAVAVMAQQSAWDVAAGLCTIAAMLPLAFATRPPVAKRVAVNASSRKRRIN
jgi:hypothetical protein